MKMIVTMLLMMVLFLGGVLIGIDKASEGVVQTRGYSTTSEAVNATADDEGVLEINVMGENFQQIDLEKKQEQYEAVQSSHLTQKVAGNLESGVKWFYNQMIHSAYQLVQVLF
ncbi:DUF3679 domain-containing protein [Aquibacillus halophilus]|nr:DUF3679 domain-containing protein [Aquibacillus halophilus]